MASFDDRKLIHEGAKILVWRARRTSDGTSVILKASRSEFPTPTERARLRHEFEILRRLTIVGVARALDLTEGDQGPVLVLEDAGSRALGAEIGAGGMDLGRFFPLASALARILAEVHRARLVHKQVSPANIVLDAQTGRPSLVDFGIASRLSREYAEVRTTTLEGTLEYLAPEQTGRMNRAVDWRSDLYSLGATFYEMLTGRPPVARAAPPEMIHAIIARPPAPPHEERPQIPPLLSAIVMKLLAKTMEERYQSGLGLAYDLEEAERRFTLTGPFEPFALGTHDAADGFRLPQKLYGRDAHLEKLLAAFDRIGQGSAAVLMVTGRSGVGKSSLVHEIHRPNAARRGYFVEGKFDQFQRIPRGTVVRALRDLIRQLLTEPEDRVLRWKIRLTEAVGESGALVTGVIPELELLIGPQPPVPDVASEENRNRINAISLRLIQAFADQAHPVVMFFDDLQWADLASLELLERLMIDPDTRHLLLLGAYRDNEVDATHPLMHAVEAMRAAGRAAGELHLGPLERSHVLELVAEALHRDARDAKALADLAFEKTQGNPFFVRAFVTSLHETGKLRRGEDGAWVWDLDAIRAHGVTDNVAVLMTERLLRLPEETQRVLQLAACIGGRFDVETLAVVCERTAGQTLRLLWPALEAEIVVPVSASRQLMRGGDDDMSSPDSEMVESSVCRFAHDWVQKAAHDLVPPETRGAVHLRIGRLLLANLSLAEREARLFEIVRQFDEGLELVTDPGERERLAELYLAAGLGAKRVAANDAARTWLAKGRSLLRGDAWQGQYALALALHVDGAETARVLLDFAEMDALVATATDHAHDALDQVPIYETRFQHHMTQNRPGDALAVTRELLSRLGAPLPARPSVLHVLASLLGTVRLVRRKKVENLATLPEMTDPAAQAAMRLMMHAASAAFISSPNLFPILACQMVKLSLRKGNSAESSWAYMLLAYLVANILGDYDEGWAIGRFALSLMERLQARELLAKNYASFYSTLAQWKSPWRDGLEPLERGQHTGVEVGDLEFACFCAMLGAWQNTFVGESLDVVQRRQAEHLAFIERHSFEFHAMCVRTVHTLVLKLRSTSERAVFLDDAVIARLVEAKNFTNLFLLALCKGVYAYLFGDADLAVEQLAQARRYEQSMLGTALASECVYFQSLAILAAWPRVTVRRRLTLRLNRRKLRVWSRQAPFNFRQKHLLVEAEWARVQGRPTEALQLYERATSEAQVNGFIQEAAIAMELGARHELRLGLDRSGWSRLYDAFRAYRSWGAIAKADALEAELNASGKGALMVQAHQTGTSALPGTSLDLSTIFNSTRAISEEIVLGTLVHELIRLLIQNAGAERGLLILERDGCLMIEAHASTAAAEAPFAAAPVEGDDRVSAAIVNYVTRTGESVVLHDAANEGIFVGDPYVVASRPKSVLCAPLVNQQKLMAIVYLENNLTTRAFTDERLEIVRILLSQAALSIHNARLYGNLEVSNRQLEEYSHTLEHKVDARTRDLRDRNDELGETLQKLRDTQQQLLSQEKLASLGALTAGIAHELKNPLNFVTNFAQLSSELAEEIAGTLAAQRPRLEPESAGELDDALQLLRGNVTKIAEHGTRANLIIDSMLMHSQSSGGARESTDLNAVVAESIRFASQGMRSKDGALDVEVSAVYDPAIGAIELAPAELRRVLINLVNNAYDAMSDRKSAASPGYAPKLTVTTRGAEDRAEVRVADNGTGISQLSIDKIFNPFFTTKAPGRGTGLGLSISHDIIVQGHQGDLRVETVPGEGTAFIISLPRKKSAIRGGELAPHD